MGDEFSQSPTKVPLAERDESIQVLLFHRSDKSCCMRVAGRRTRKIRATVRATRSGPASSMLVPTKTGYALTRDTAICIVDYTVAAFTRPGGQSMPEQKALSTFFMVRSESGWLIAAAQTTAVNAEVIARLQSR